MIKKILTGIAMMVAFAGGYFTDQVVLPEKEEEPWGMCHVQTGDLFGAPSICEVCVGEGRATLDCQPLPKVEPTKTEKGNADSHARA